LQSNGANAQEEQALRTWIVRDEEGVRTNALGFPYGRPYRAVADDLAQLGIVNGKGKAYHPHHLKQLIARAIVKKTYAAVGYAGKDPEAQKRLYSEIWRQLRLKQPYRRQK